MDYFLQLLIMGLIIGGLYAMIALGFVLIYKATGVLNFAQGPLVTLGAFFAWTSLAVLKLPFPLALLLTSITITIFALLIGRVVLRPLIGKSIISVIMVTVGLYFILEGGIQIIWGSEWKTIPKVLPNISVIIGPIVVPPSYFWGFIVGIVSVTFFALFFKFSKTGIAMRAVAENQQAALSLGVSVRLVIGVSWAISATVAAIGGLFLANISGFNTRMSEIGLMMFPIVILGGLDSIPGAVLGGFCIGIIQNFAGGYIEPIIKGGFMRVFPFIILIFILMIKPYGFFGTERIERL